MSAALFGATFPNTAQARNEHDTTTDSFSTGVCGATRLSEVARGQRIDRSVTLGSITARVTAVSAIARNEMTLGNTAVMRQGTVEITDGHDYIQRYILPRTRYYAGKPPVNTLARLHVRHVAGRATYLCLVQFDPKTPAFAVLAVTPSCMTACARIVLIPPIGKTKSVPTGPLGFAIVPSSQSALLVTDDPRFWGRFASASESLDPIRIFGSRDGAIVNVTADHRHRVASDAKHAWRVFQRLSRGRKLSDLGALAAWAADECVLGDRAQTFDAIDHLAREHKLRGDSPRLGGSHFVRHLRLFLTRTGYIR